LIEQPDFSALVQGPVWIAESGLFAPPLQQPIAAPAQLVADQARYQIDGCHLHTAILGENKAKEIPSKSLKINGGPPWMPFELFSHLVLWHLILSNSQIPLQIKEFTSLIGCLSDWVPSRNTFEPK